MVSAAANFQARLTWLPRGAEGLVKIGDVHTLEAAQCYEIEIIEHRIDGSVNLVVLRKRQRRLIR
jgi:hypothetical protein